MIKTTPFEMVFIIRDQMSQLIAQLFTWMPLPLAALCVSVVAIFFIVTLLRVLALILDVIPFL